MAYTIRSSGAAAVALLAAVVSVPVGSAAQQAPQGTPQVPPSNAQRTGNLPLRDVRTSYSPAGKRVSPQDGLVMQQRSSRPTPRDADGHPDLSGNWVVNFPNPIGTPGLRRRGAFEPDQAVMQRGAQWNKPLYKPEYWEKVRSLDFSKADVDPNYGCGKPSGVPRQNVPSRIVQKDGQIWLFNNVTDSGLRILPLDGRPRDPQDEQFSTWNGMGHARWEGDVLVVESVGFNDQSWLGWEGYFHSDKMKVTERFLREGDLLFYTFTVDDPEVLMEPWTSYTYVRRLNPNPSRIDEAAPCDERDIDLLVDPFLRG
ncbi:MAG: hypothetical protein A3I61_09660 [Acidobacteria bacterium RIFCSPLOWO2_02_FULL_68_18]|nr:MAG: hypothetical protein A3I61_09660 [Acidobacteria bacterium RIFCSPLOWO2_02_FULL_68_18]OFW51027.1 MAG: hypothetical protein A3G77_15495 [Acidobacteria bacterium RIFCSPLOWO2_12_FULL_68_19]